MNESPGISFGVAAESEQTPADYGFVGLQSWQIASWHVDGLLQSSSLIGPWLEAEDAQRERPNESTQPFGTAAPIDVPLSQRLDRVASETRSARRGKGHRGGPAFGMSLSDGVAGAVQARRPSYVPRTRALRRGRSHGACGRWSSAPVARSSPPAAWPSIGAIEDRSWLPFGVIAHITDFRNGAPSGGGLRSCQLFSGGSSFGKAGWTNSLFRSRGPVGPHIRAARIGQLHAF